MECQKGASVLEREDEGIGIGLREGRTVFSGMWNLKGGEFLRDRNEGR
jgi:hypothetical protein